MQKKFSFERKEGISCDLRKIANKYYGKQEQAGGQFWDYSEDIFFNSKPVLYIMRELLAYTDIPAANRNMNILKTEYDRYCENHKKVDFQIEDLFQDGWLKWRIDEWGFSFLYGLERLDTKNEKLHIKQIVSFLKNLKIKLWEESKQLKVNIYARELQKFLKQCSVNKKWLIKHEVLCKKQGEYYIDPYSEVWKRYGDIVIANYINKCIEKEQVFEVWMNLSAAFPRCCMTEILDSDLDLLYGACLAYLEHENGTWEQEELYLSVFVRVEQENLHAKIIECQDMTQGRYSMWEERCSQLCQYQNLFGTRQEIAFRFCIIKYFDVSRELAARFRKLLTVPVYYLDFFCIHTKRNIAILADCVEESGIEYEAIVTLHKRLMDFASDMGRVSMEDLHYFGTCVQNVLYNDVFLSSKDSDKNRYELFINWMLYLYQFEHRHNIEIYGMAFLNGKKTDLYQGILEWIHEEMLLVPNEIEALLKEFRKRILQCEDEKMHCYLGMAVDAAGMCRGNVFINEEQISRLFSDIFINWCERVQKYDISVLYIDWDMFDKGVWGDLLAVYAKEFSEEFLLKYNVFIKALLEDDKDKKSIHYGKMYLIYCYIAAIFLGRFRKELSDGLRLHMENVLSQDFLKVHNRFRFFTEDNISNRLGQKVISECMKGLLVISDAGRAEFAKGLRLLQSPDMLFWDGCTDSEIIREAYIDVLSDMARETINKEPDSIYIQMTEQIFRLSSELKKKSGPNEKQQLVKLTETADMILRKMEEMKGNPYAEKNQEWMKAARYRLLIIQGKKAEVLSGDDDFYKGIIYIEANDYENLHRAEKIFSRYLKTHSVSEAINYMITLAGLILKGNEEGRDVDIKQNWEKFQKVREYLLSYWQIFPEGKEYIIYYTLLIDMEIGNKVDAWSMVQMLKNDKEYDSIISDSYVAKALVSFYVSENEESLAEEVIEIYDHAGKKSTADEMRKILKEKGWEHDDNKGNLAESPGISLNKEPDKKLLRAMITLVKGSDKDVQAYVMLPELRMEEKKEYSKYESNRLSGIIVVHILHMVFQAVCKLQEYKCDLLKNGSLAYEDTYNRFFMRLFNDMNSLTQYTMSDQSQGGTTWKKYQNGEMVPGERDMILKFKNNEIMLVEGIRQNERIKNKIIADHIRKLENYNASGMDLALVLIYTDFDEMDQQWEKYVSLLQKFQKECNYGIISVEKSFDWKNAGIIPPNNYICRTHHKYHSGYEVYTYHIMVKMK